MKLLTEAVLKKLPPLRTTEKQGDRAKVIVKFFTPDANWTWYATQFDGVDTFYGLIDGLEKELGYFSLAELMKVRGRFGLPVERDRHFKERALEEIRKN